MTLIAGTIALVGRPNVGKSTLFNRLCGGRDALVHDQPGLTRDRKYGRAQIGEKTATVIDTGGLHDSSTIADHVNSQVWQAVDEADVIVALIDAKTGLTASDEVILGELRTRNKPIQLVANKVDGVKQTARFALESLQGLGLSEVAFVSAAHGEGINELRERLEPHLQQSAETLDYEGIRVAVIGRPNVGKSTLVNAMLGDARCVVFDEPGTTRDSIYVPFERGQQRFVFIDTAGIRRKGRVNAAVEKFSVVKALDAMNAAEVALLVIDANEGLVEQDLHIVSYAVEAGTGLILVVNKTDVIDGEQQRNLKNTLMRRLRFADWIPIQRTAALRGIGVQKLFSKITQVYQAGEIDCATSELNRVLENAVRDHSPPAVHGRPIKLRYVNKVSDHPPTLLIHGNQIESLPASYVRYLENKFRTALNIAGMPIVIHVRNSENPFADRKNELTQRQLKQRRRLIRHRKARSKAK